MTSKMLINSSSLIRTIIETSFNFQEEESLTDNAETSDNPEKDENISK